MMSDFFSSVLGTVMSVNVDEKILALTFDDGPDPVFTPDLLALLSRFNVKATFFVVGKAAERNPHLLSRIMAEGHALGVHSWDHTSFSQIPSLQRLKQIQDCARVLKEWSPRLFRPPYGHQSWMSIIEARLLGYEIVGGEGATEDWRPLESSELLQRLNAQVSPGNILILHDHLFAPGPLSQRDRRPLLMALENFFEIWSMSYQFVTIETLLKKGRPVRKIWRCSPAE